MNRERVEKQHNESRKVKKKLFTTKKQRRWKIAKCKKQEEEKNEFASVYFERRIWDTFMRSRMLNMNGLSRIQWIYVFFFSVCCRCLSFLRAAAAGFTATCSNLCLKHTWYYVRIMYLKMYCPFLGTIEHRGWKDVMSGFRSRDPLFTWVAFLLIFGYNCGAHEWSWKKYRLHKFDRYFLHI